MQQCSCSSEKAVFYCSLLREDNRTAYETFSTNVTLFEKEFLIKVLIIKGWFDSWFVHDVDSLDDLTLIVYIA